MNKQATTQRSPYTDTTWASIGNVLGTHWARPGDAPKPHGPTGGWTELRDLELELTNRFPHLSNEAAQALVSGTQSCLPVILTWDTNLGDGRIERAEGAVFVEGICLAGERAARIRVRYWGFCHDVYVKDVRDAAATEMTLTYRPVND